MPHPNVPITDQQQPRRCNHDQVRKLEASHLDALQAALWAEVINGTWQAAQTVLKIMDQWAKPLGLHQSARTDAVTPAGGAQHSTSYFPTMSIVPQ